MRFFKIFIICFFSLIGAISAIVGVMYLVGALNQNKIEPESIYFEQSAYNEDGDFLVKIMTPTENVTATKVTLSLSGVVSEADGFISDGVVIVPKTVNLGHAFTVKLCEKQDEEVNKSWIVGGQTVMTAKSESIRANQVTTNINVDVPVESVSVITYPNSQVEEGVTYSTFAVGESFIAEAVFKPVRSMYKYGSATECKEVYFDISASVQSVITPDTEINAELTSSGIKYKKGYKVLKQGQNINVNAYAFQSASIEEQYIADTMNNTEEILRVLKNTNDVGEGGQSPSITCPNRTVGTFTVGASDSIKYIGFNQITKIYANNSSSANTLGITVKDSDGVKLPGKIRDIGVRACYLNGTNAGKTADKILFIDNNTRNVSTNTRVVGEGENAKTYYFPTITASNLDNSYWSVVSSFEDASVDIYFELYIFDNNDAFANESERCINTKNLQNYKTTVVMPTSLTWQSTSDVKVTVIDGDKIVAGEYDISSNINFNLDGTYQIVKYFAYSESDLDLSKVITGAKLTTEYDVLNSIGDFDLYLLTSPKMQIVAGGTFNVLGAIIKTDFNNKLIKNGGIYVSHGIITSSNLTSQAKALKIISNKTLKSLDAEISITKDATTPLKLKNLPTDEQTPLNFLAFKDNDTNIFNITFILRAGTSEEREQALADDTLLASLNAKLKEEIKIFVNDYSKIELFAKTVNGDNKTNILAFTQFNQIALSNLDVSAIDNNLTEWSQTLSVNVGETSDTSVYIGFTYKQTENTSVTKNITNVSFDGEVADLTYENDTGKNYVTIEIYDGKVFSAEFNYDEYLLANELTNDIANPIYQKNSLEKGDAIENSEAFYIKDMPSVKYSTDSAGEEIIPKTFEESTLIDDSNNFVITFKDKFGNVLPVTAGEYYTTEEIISGVTKRSVTVKSEFMSSSKASGTILQDSLFFSKILSGEVDKVMAKQLNSEELSSGTQAYTMDDVENYNNIINISRYALGTSEVAYDIAGKDGLLSVLYELDGIKYELSPILNYTFITQIDDPDSEYSNVFSYTDGKLTVKKNISKKIDLLLKVSSGLGFEFTIQLSVLPNISVVSNEIAVKDLGGNIISSGVAVGDKIVYSIYSDSDAIFHIPFELAVANPTLMFTNQIFDDNSTLTATTETQVLKVKVNFDSTFISPDALQKVIVSTSGDFTSDIALDFKFVVYVKVLANLTLTSGGQNVSSLEKNLVIDSFNNFSVISNTDYKRITAGSDILTDKLGLGVTSVQKISVDGSLSQTDNIFTTDTLNIKATSKLTGKYKLNINVFYDNNLIGSVSLTVSPSISQASSSQFAVYKGIDSLYLTSEGEYTKANILSFFNNVNDIKIKTTNSLGLIDTTTLDVYKVSEVSKFYFDAESGVELTLISYISGTNTVIAEVVYPVLISPYILPCVTYKNGDGTMGGDIYKLANASYYQIHTDIFDEYNSDSTASLFIGGEKLYGLSAEILQKIKNDTAELALYLCDKDGNVGGLVPNTICTFNGQTGDLTIKPLIEEQFVYVVVSNKDLETNVIYKIKLIPTSAINIYYPYAKTFADISNMALGEYISEDAGTYTEINLNEKLSQKFPNSVNDTTRVRLEKLENEAYLPITGNITYNYTINKVVYDGSEYTNYAMLSSMFGIDLTSTTGELVITKTTLPKERIFDIWVNCNAKLNSDGIIQDMGSVIYKIFVNSPAPSTYSLKTVTEDVTATITQNFEYAPLSAGATEYDFSKVTLYKSVSDSTIVGPAPLTDIGYKTFGAYAYIVDEDGTFVDTTDIVKIENKKLILEKSIVSNYKVHLVFYTIYGVIEDVEVTFISNVSFEISSESPLKADGDRYTVFADEDIDLRKIAIKQGETSLTVEKYTYKINNGETISSENLYFAQNSGSKSLKVIASLEGFDEDYIFTLEVDVTNSLSSNFASQALNLGTRTYTPNSQSFDLTDILYGTGSNSLFKVLEHTSVIEKYTESISKNDNAEIFIGDVTLNKSTNVITVNYNNKSPSSSTEIEITIHLTRGDLIISSTFKFTLNSDVTITANLPTPDGINSVIETEYLPKNFISGYAEQNKHGDVNLSKQFSLNGKAIYNNSNRITANDESFDFTRLTYSVYLNNPNSALVLWTGALETKYNSEIQNVPYDQVINIQWLGTSAIDYDETVYFNVYVDGILRLQYQLNLTTDLSLMYSHTLNNLYTSGQNTEANSEVFYVEKESTENIFSHKTALLKFTGKSTTATLEFRHNTGDELLGEIKIVEGGGEYQVVLISDSTDITSLSDIYAQVKGISTKYYFDIASDSSVYGNFILVNSAKMSYRLEIKYMGKTLSYENFKSKTLIAAQAPESYTFSKYNSEAIYEDALNQVIRTTPNNVKIIVNGDYQINYYYLLKYDFKVLVNYQSTENKIMTAGTQQNLYQFFGITDLSGENYTDAYFNSRNVDINAEIIMVTNNAFANDAKTSNVLYMNNSYFDFCKVVSSSLTQVNKTSLGWVTTAKVDGKSYEYDLIAHGAENDGNYVYILVQYGIKGEDNSFASGKSTYEIVKLKVTPKLDQVTLYSTPGITENTNESPLEVSYALNFAGQYAITPVTLSRTGYNKGADYIYIDAGGKNSIYSASSYALSSELSDYLVLDFSDANKLVLRQNGANVAKLGDKNGTLTITDAYGYVSTYYIRLSAASKEPLAVSSDPYVNAIAGTVNHFYSGTNLCVIDSGTTITLENKSAIKINNLNNVADITNIRYSLSGFDAISNLNNECTLPNVDILTETTLKITFTIQNATYSETVTLSVDIRIKPKFSLNIENAYAVRDEIDFSVSDFVNLHDESNSNANLGKSTYIKTKTIKICATDAGITVTITAEDVSTYSAVITIGKDFFGSDLTSTDGYYYYTLNFGEFAGKDLSKSTISVSGISYTEINDVIFSVITAKNTNASSQEVYLNIKNATNNYKLPFALNMDAKQNISLFTAIQNDILVQEDLSVLTNKSELLENLYQFKICATPFDKTDLIKLKNLKIYDDNLEFNITGDKSGLNISGIVSGGNLTASIPFDIEIKKAYSHKLYVSLSNILGNNFDLSEAYDVTITYRLSTSERSIILVGGSEGVPNYINGIYEFTSSLTNFTFIDKTNSVENINVLTSSAFDENLRTTIVEKFYIIEYSEDNLIAKSKINYTVTPKYFALDNSENVEAKTLSIYANQVKIDSADGKTNYTINFAVWASKFFLTNYEGQKILSINSDLPELKFVRSAGDCTIDASGNITTTKDYTPSNKHFRIDVFAKVNTGDYIKIGQVVISINHDAVYVPYKGEYSFIITHKTAGSSALLAKADFSASNILSLDDLITNNTSIDNNKKGDGTVIIGATPCLISECNIEVLTVLKDVYSIKYNSSNKDIDIEIAITRNMSSQGKTVNLLLKANESFTAKPLALTVGTDYSIQTNLTGLGTFETKSDGIAIVSIPKSMLFTDNFIGEDYFYTCTISYNETITDLTYVYAENVEDLSQAKTVYFTIACTTSLGKNTTEYIALNNTDINKNNGRFVVKTADVFALEEDETLLNCTLVYKAFDKNEYTNALSYNVLMTSTTNQQKLYTALCFTYKESGAFKVKFSSASGLTTSKNLTFDILSSSASPITTPSFPSSVILDEYYDYAEVKYKNIEDTKRYYLGVHANGDADHMQIRGIMSNAEGKIEVDFSAFSEITTLAITFLNQSLFTDMDSLATGTATYWTASVGDNTILTKAVLDKSSSVWTFDNAFMVYKSFLLNVSKLNSLEFEADTPYYITFSQNLSYEIYYFDTDPETITNLSGFFGTNNTIIISTTGFYNLASDTVITFKATPNFYEFEFTISANSGEESVLTSESGLTVIGTQDYILTVSEPINTITVTMIERNSIK